MKQHTKIFFAFLATMLMISMACAGSAPAATPTAIISNTNTALPPTNTATPRPTSTPRPTATEIPPTATAAPMKVPAANEQYEVTVLYARYFAKVFSGGFAYTPYSGGKFLDVGVVVKNLQPDKTLNISWENVYIVIVKNGDVFYPNFGGSYVPQNSGENFDPATLFLYPEDAIENLVFKDTIYLRCIWATDGDRPATYLFGFDISPIVEVVMP